MTSTKSAAAQVQWSEFLPQLVVIALAALLVLVGKIVFYLTHGLGYVFFLVAAMALAVSCWQVTYKNLATTYRVTVRSLALILGMYALLAYPSFDTATHPHAAGLIYAYMALPWIALAGAIATWFPFGIRDGGTE